MDGLHVRVALLPPGGAKDPDAFIRSAGPAAFQAVIDAAQPWPEFRFRHEEDQITDATDVYERARIVLRLLPVFSNQFFENDAIIRAHYRRRLAAIGQVDERTVAGMLGDPLPEPVPEPGAFADDIVAQMWDVFAIDADGVCAIVGSGDINELRVTAPHEILDAIMRWAFPPHEEPVNPHSGEMVI